MKIGFIGLGMMGSGMAANLQKAGHDLVVHDLRRAAAEPCLANGAAWADTPVGTWGQGAPYYNDYRWQHQVNESMNFGRTFQLRERMFLSVRAEFFNVFNRLNLPAPSSSNPTQTATFNSAGVPTGGFGYITNSSGIGSQRNGQFIARFQF